MDGIKEMIDCHNRSINSLADNNNYKLLANALDDMDTTNAFFSSESQSLSSIKTCRRKLPRDSRMSGTAFSCGY